MRLKIGKPMHFGATQVLFKYAQEMRSEKSTPAEQKLWARLKSKQLNGYKFRFQHPIMRFIADFYCHEMKLVIEIDGGYHFGKEQQKLDEGRTEWLNELGIKVIRFTNEEVLNDIEKVLLEIAEELAACSPCPPEGETER